MVGGPRCCSDKEMLSFTLYSDSLSHSSTASAQSGVTDEPADVLYSIVVKRGESQDEWMNGNAMKMNYSTLLSMPFK